MVFEPGTGILWWRSFFPLFLLKSAEAVTLMAVICIISEMQQEEKAGFGQTEALRCGWASCSEGEPPPHENAGPGPPGGGGRQCGGAGAVSGSWLPGHRPPTLCLSRGPVGKGAALTCS